MKQTKIITLLITFSLLFIVTPVFSQVSGTGIGTVDPDPSAALDVVNNAAGILIPRMTETQKNAINTPSVGLLVYDTTNKCISQNSGTPFKPVWVCLSVKDKHSSFFYLPAMTIDTSIVGTVAKPLDLYATYKNQFMTPISNSPGSPASIEYFPNPTDFYYYISYYDNTVIQIDEITADGKMSYKILKESNYSSHMNVVFVIK